MTLKELKIGMKVKIIDNYKRCLIGEIVEFKKIPSAYKNVKEISVIAVQTKEFPDWNILVKSEQIIEILN